MILGALMAAAAGVRHPRGEIPGCDKPLVADLGGGQATRRDFGFDVRPVAGRKGGGLRDGEEIIHQYRPGMTHDTLLRLRSARRSSRFPFFRHLHHY